MHIADVEKGNLGATGIVGGNIPVATGAALSMKLQGSDSVVLCFFGDGAANTGNFHEALNMASIWDLPVVFICENNLYGMSVPFAQSARTRTSPSAPWPTTFPARWSTDRTCWPCARRSGAPLSAHAADRGQP